MRELTHEELKQAELDILKDVARFCEENHLRYYLGGGTLLGAVRHKGFIPWDDDIDISMPRPDYLQFIHTYNREGSRYFVKSIEIDDQYVYTNAKVYDGKTYLLDYLVRKPAPYSGVHIDIFPIDGLPKSRVRQRFLFLEQEMLLILARGSSMGYVSSHKYYDSAKKGGKIKGWLRTALKFGAITVFRFLPTSRLLRKINTNLEQFPYESSEEVACLVACIHGAACERLSKAEFEPRMFFDFEGIKLQGSAGYVTYLKQLYGNYMKLPPEANRIAHHNFSAFYRN